MPSPIQEQLSVAAPGELVELVAYLLGFHPNESMVVLGLAPGEGAGRAGEDSGYGGYRVQVAARIDLPAPAAASAEVPALLQAVLGARVDAIAVIVFTDAVVGDPRASAELAQLTRTLTHAARATGVLVLDVLVASKDAWWSLQCHNADCCRPTGSRRLGASSVVAAQATFAGLPAWPDRESMKSQLEGDSPAERDLLLPLVTRAQRSGAGRREGTAQQVQLLRRALRRLATGPDPRAALTDAQVARFGSLLQNQLLRDELWLGIDDGSLQAAPLLDQLHRRLPPPYDAPALFLRGWASWRSGNGTLAAMTARRALDSDPSYSAAELLLSALATGLDPHRMPSLRSTWTDRDA